MTFVEKAMAIVIIARKYAGSRFQGGLSSWFQGRVSFLVLCAVWEQKDESHSQANRCLPGV